MAFSVFVTVAVRKCFLAFAHMAAKARRAGLLPNLPLG